MSTDTRTDTPARPKPSLRFSARDLLNTAIWAYTVFALSIFTPVLPLLVDRNAYLTTSSWTQMGDEYVNAAGALLTGPVLGMMALVILVAGFLGGLLGSAVLRKHFVRAGLA